MLKAHSFCLNAHIKTSSVRTLHSVKVSLNAALEEECRLFMVSLAALREVTDASTTETSPKGSILSFAGLQGFQ